MGLGLRGVDPTEIKNAPHCISVFKRFCATHALAVVGEGRVHAGPQRRVGDGPGKVRRRVRVAPVDEILAQ